MDPTTESQTDAGSRATKPIDPTVEPPRDTASPIDPTPTGEAPRPASTAVGGPIPRDTASPIDPTPTGEAPRPAATAVGDPTPHDTASPIVPTGEAPRPAGTAVGDPTPRDTAPPIVGPAVRTWLSYVVPLTILSALALSPLVALALATPAPADLAGVKAVLARGWTLLAIAWPCQLVLVGAASVMTRGPRSQLGALGGGFVQLVRAALPCGVAAAAVAIGCLALAVPGPILLVLLALTGASRERGLPAPLFDSIAAVRRQLPAVALAVTALLAIDTAIGLCAFRAFVVPFPARPTPAQFGAIRDFVRAIALGLVVASPLLATVLATIRTRAEPSYSGAMQLKG